MRHWINVMNREHVERGLEDGFTEADHERPARPRRLDTGAALAVVAEAVGADGHV